METDKQTNWTSVLGRIVYTMNCEVSRTTKLCPYELVFGISPHKDRVLLDELYEAGITEEILAEGIIEIESNDEIESDDEIRSNNGIGSNDEIGSNNGIESNDEIENDDEIGSNNEIESNDEIENEYEGRNCLCY